MSEKEYKCQFCGTTNHADFYSGKGRITCKRCAKEKNNILTIGGYNTASSASSQNLISLSKKDFDNIMRRLESLDDAETDEILPEKEVPWRKFVDLSLETDRSLIHGTRSQMISIDMAQKDTKAGSEKLGRTVEEFAELTRDKFEELIDFTEKVGETGGVCISKINKLTEENIELKMRVSELIESQKLLTKQNEYIREYLSEHLGALNGSVKLVVENYNQVVSNIDFLKKHTGLS